MEFTLINDINEKQLKKVIGLMVGDGFEYKYISGEIEQKYHCKPLLISITPRIDYVKVATGLENGWPFLEHVIQTNKYTGMRIRYVDDSIAEFYRWEEGNLIRMLYALKDTKWVWYGRGSIQEWENTEQYNNRYIRKRLTKQLLQEYLWKCGYEENF